MKAGSQITEGWLLGIWGQKGVGNGSAIGQLRCRVSWVLGFFSVTVAKLGFFTHPQRTKGVQEPRDTVCTLSHMPCAGGHWTWPVEEWPLMHARSTRAHYHPSRVLWLNWRHSLSACPSEPRL